MMKVKYIGPFKSYFAAKMLRVAFPAVHVKCVVGPKLEVEREHGAFRIMFGNVFEDKLDDSVHVYLLRHVVRLCKEMEHDKQSICSLIADDDFEHALCEWVKATRGKEAFLKNAAARKSGRGEGGGFYGSF